MWKIDDYPVENMLDDLISKVNEGRISHFPELCPICGEKEVHIYFNKHGLHGGVWVWCSNCRHYTHGSCITPPWWENCPDINEIELTHAPDILEKEIATIDKHINKLLDLSNDC